MRDLGFLVGELQTAFLQAERTHNAQAPDDRNWVAIQALELLAQTIRSVAARLAPHVSFALNTTAIPRVVLKSSGWDQAIQNVLKKVIEPATDAVGSEVTYPRLGPISRVGLITEAAMTAFARPGDGQCPVPEHVAPLWRNVVLTAFREDVALKPQELTAWFVSSGWDEPAAGELARQFYGDIALLAEHEEAERQPA
jgi:hypothetical protein